MSSSLHPVPQSCRSHHGTPGARAQPSSQKGPRGPPAAMLGSAGVSATRMRGPSPGCSATAMSGSTRGSVTFTPDCGGPLPGPLLGLEFTALGFDLHLQRVSCQDWRWGARMPRTSAEKREEKEAAAYTQEAALLTPGGCNGITAPSPGVLSRREFTWP